MDGILLDVVKLVVGFVLLIKGADFFVDGSSATAKILRIPEVIVGCTIVSMGTSLPELAVSTTAAMQGSNEIAFSNVVGSNIFNILVVLGMTAAVNKKPIPVNPSMLKLEFPLNTIVTVLLGIFSIDLMLGQNVFTSGNLFTFANGEILTGTLSRIEAILLLLIFVLYMYITVRNAIKARNESADQPGETTMSTWKAILLIVAGIVMIKYGGDLTVNGAKAVAAFFGMSETLIGLTIVACGTSLPELVTSLVAARKGEADLAVGNAIGSCVFNALFILGISALIHPIGIIASSVIDVMVLVVVTLISWYLAKTKQCVGRWEGILMVALYAVYLWYIIIR